jgi:hypothetical protein
MIYEQHRTAQSEPSDADLRLRLRQCGRWQLRSIADASTTNRAHLRPDGLAKVSEQGDRRRRQSLEDSSVFFRPAQSPTVRGRSTLRFAASPKPAESKRDTPGLICWIVRAPKQRRAGRDASIWTGSLPPLWLLTPNLWLSNLGGGDGWRAKGSIAFSGSTAAQLCRAPRTVD